MIGNTAGAPTAAWHWEDGIEWAAVTDVGLRRSNNQDSIAVVRASGDEQERNRGDVFLVADGMGAHAVGELASQMATENIPHAYRKSKGVPAADALRAAFRQAGQLIHQRGQDNREFAGMGTTATALVLLPTGALVGQVGDSRAYRVRWGRIEQLSRDHSLAWEVVRRKQMTYEEAVRTVPRNVITRSLGPEAAVEVDIEGPFPVERGDVFVLCSDGLCGPVPDALIGAVASCLPPSDAAQGLVDLANFLGGPDNISAIVIRLGPASGPPPDGSSVPPIPSRRRSIRPAPSLELACLAGALGCGLVALGLHALGWPGAGVAIILSLLGFLGAAAAGAWRHRGALIKPPAHVRTKAVVYRSEACAPQRSIIERLAALENRYDRLAVQNSWPLAWNDYTARRAEAEAARASQDPVAAVRASMRSLRVLAQGIQELRARHTKATAAFIPEDFLNSADDL